MTPKQLAAIHKLCFTQPRPWSEDEFQTLLDSRQIQLVTSADGFAVLQIAGPEAELLTIAVSPDSQGTGQGTELLNTVLEQAKTAGCEEIFLEVVDENVIAISLYRKAGFDDRAIRKDYYDGLNGRKSSALIMHKTL